MVLSGVKVGLSLFDHESGIGSFLAILAKLFNYIFIIAFPFLKSTKLRVKIRTIILSTLGIAYCSLVGLVCSESLFAVFSIFLYSALILQFSVKYTILVSAIVRSSLLQFLVSGNSFITVLTKLKYSLAIFVLGFGNILCKNIRTNSFDLRGIIRQRICKLLLKVKLIRSIFKSFVHLVVGIVNLLNSLISEVSKIIAEFGELFLLGKPIVIGFSCILAALSKGLDHLPVLLFGFRSNSSLIFNFLVNIFFFLCIVVLSFYRLFGLSFPNIKLKI